MFARSIAKIICHQPSQPLSLPPTYLLPLRARLTTVTTTTDPNPPEASFNHTPTSQTPTNSVPSPPPPPAPQRPHRLSRRSPLPPPTNANLALLPLLAAQPPHYITAHLHSRPYLLTAGDTLRLPFHMPAAPPGTVLRLNRASMIGSRDYTFRGAPYVDEGSFVCRAVVVGIEGEPMRVVEKTKRRQRKVKTVRSKMRFTILRVKELRVLATEEERREERERELVEAEEEELETLVGEGGR
ncbi:MAG: hypothetical protein ASARMPREDX12_006305 [Alectoria sarmentosa]|nr:MAG: hypothetical protein ASARMPREDX12_006305 [Alectoria sarmentosa]